MKDLKKIDIRLKIERNVLKVDMDVIDKKNKLIFLDEVLSTIYKMKIATNETEILLWDLCKDKPEDQFLYLDKVNFKVIFENNIEVEVKFDFEKYEIGTVWQLVENRIKKVITKIDEYLEDKNEVILIMPLDLS